MSSPADDLFSAAGSADLERVRFLIGQGADVHAVGPDGFTALAEAVIGTHRSDPDRALAVIGALVAAGAPLEHGGGGRTPLYLAAEYSHDIRVVRLLLEAGAAADVRDGDGNHVTTNAMLPEVALLLSEVTGHPIRRRAHLEPPTPLTAAEWRSSRRLLDAVFVVLEERGLVCVQASGSTQGEALDDCVEQFHERADRSRILGFCFFTRQDRKRAKGSGQLSLGIWGAPDGGGVATEAVGALVVAAFTEAGFTAEWDRTADQRPSVDLRSGL